MIIKRAASIPLILHDPFFSIWSSADHLYDNDTVHWCGNRQAIRGYLTVGDKTYCFMGDKEFHAVIPQTSIDVTATATRYTFENDILQLTCTFTSPLLPKDMTLLSRPCTYIDIDITKKRACEVCLHFEISADLVRTSDDHVVGFTGKYTNSANANFTYTSMGRAGQQPLNGSDDRCTIDWGYVYLASCDAYTSLSFDAANEKIRLEHSFATEQSHTDFIIAYDDLLSINYFGQWRKAYWTHTYHTILDAIEAAFYDKTVTLEKAAALDTLIDAKAHEIGGENYSFLCNMCFRHVWAAHKLITDEEGNIIFLSKENASNGCIGTVDVSYPSLPLLLLFDTEYVKGMLRPAFRFAACDVWEYDFAPHDVGRYPYAWGQVYGLDRSQYATLYYYDRGKVYPPFYAYPKGSHIYDFSKQMPVEESGNMLIMTAAVCIQDKSPEFARPYWDFLTQWKEYLIKYGADPGDQLCTDDFAGHLAHNVNLAVKAIMGIEAYAKLADMLGYTEEAAKHHQLAKEMAADWEKRAISGDHYRLTFDNPDSWSLKYNLIWDKLWNCEFFSEEVYEKELAYYEKVANPYGIPLDSRSTGAKSDWNLWCAALADDKEQLMRLLQPVANYLENTGTRVPFSDYYFSDTGLYRSMIARSVQGGMFMPMLRKGTLI